MDDINKIKARLAALRPEDLQSEDPEIEELLMLVEEDLELAEWFAREQVFDQLFADKLQEIEPPAGLDERIIAAMEQAKAAKTAEVVTESIETPLESAEASAEIEETPADVTEKVTPFTEEPVAKPAVVKEERGSCIPFSPAKKRAWWQNPTLISAAAGIVLALFVGISMFSGPKLSADTLEDFYTKIGNHHQSHAPLDMQSADLDEIRGYLSAHGAPTPGKLPPNIDPLPEVGCTVMQWGGEVISVVRMDDHETVDVYIARAGLFPDFASRHQPQTVNLEQIVVLAWTDGDVIYFLVRTGDLTEINNLL